MRDTESQELSNSLTFLTRSISPLAETSKQLAVWQLVRQASECHRIKARVARRLQTVENCPEIDVALAGVKVNLLFAGINGQAHLADTANAKGIQKSVNILRYQVGMVHGIGPTEAFG